MPRYYVLMDEEKEYPCVKELAEQLAKVYGIVNRKCEPHDQFVRAYLEEDLRNGNGVRMMSESRPHVQVYSNSEAIFNFAEDLLPQLEEEKMVVVSIPEGDDKPDKQWKLFWAETLRAHKKIPRPAYSMRVYRPKKKKCELDIAS